jgi:hypothetical protein
LGDLIEQKRAHPEHSSNPLHGEGRDTVSEHLLPAYGADAGLDADARNQTIHEVSLRSEENGRFIVGVYGGDALSHRVARSLTPCALFAWRITNGKGLNEISLDCASGRRNQNCPLLRPA